MRLPDFDDDTESVGQNVCVADRTICVKRGSVCCLDRWSPRVGIEGLKFSCGHPTFHTMVVRNLGLRQKIPTSASSLRDIEVLGDFYYFGNLVVASWSLSCSVFDLLISCAPSGGTPEGHSVFFCYVLFHVRSVIFILHSFSFQLNIEISN